VNFESLNSGSGASTAAAGTALSTSGKTVGHRVLGGGRASFLVETSDLLTLANFTLRNPHVRSTSWDNQAEALYFNTSQTAAAARLVAKQMNFLSQQDTLQLKGYNWFYQSLVAGNVDFIWGGVMASLFEECEIRSVADTGSSSAGFILQARAVPGDKGFVFLNSTLTAEPTVTQAYLARSGGTTATTYVDHIAFVNTKMGPHILPAGWCVGTGTSKTGTGTGTCSSNPPPWAGTADGGATDAAGWREFGSMDLNGAPLDVSARLGTASVKVAGVPTSIVLARQLGSADGLTTRAEIFKNSTIATGAPGGWVPAP
jgi:pectin methylesterase-like acyl-CoA thioesterase